MTEKKIRKVTKKFKFLNFVLFPTEMQKPAEYVKVLSRIHGDKIKVKTFSDRQTFITSFDQIGNYYHGVLSNAVFVDPESKSINKETYEISGSKVNPDEGLGLKQWEFWFYPKYHRLAFNSQNSQSQIFKFFDKAFLEVLGSEDDYAIYVEKDRQAIDRIMNSKCIKKLIVDISYSNNSNYEDWKALMDTDFHEGSVRKAHFEFWGTISKPLDVLKTKFMKASLGISKSNGSAKAVLQGDGGRTEYVDTKDHPKVSPVSYTNNLEEMLEREISDISNDNDQ